MIETLTPLCDLAIKYRTDKVGVFMHHYTPVYHQLFKDKRDTVSKVLEIGIGYDNKAGMEHIQNYKGGASLRMWEEYFYNAIIFGADINVTGFINSGRIRSFYVDQSNQASLINLSKEVGTDFDIIIDDGSHKPDHYILTAKTLLFSLKKDGVYIIEDVHYAFIDRIIRELGDQYNVEIVRLNPANEKTLVDDNLAIIRNK
jgi:hypothetical protein